MNDHPVVNPSYVPVGTNDAIQPLQVASGRIGDFGIVGLDGDAPIVLMNTVPPECRVFIEPGGWQTPDPFEGRIDVEDLRWLRLREPRPD